MKIVKNKQLAEDIVQDVFVKVQTKSEQLRDEEKVKGWIYQITRNAIIDHYRKEWKDVSCSGIDWFDGDQFNYNECVGRYIATLLPQLPALYREALELTEVENLSHFRVDICRRGLTQSILVTVMRTCQVTDLELILRLTILTLRATPVWANKYRLTLTKS